LWCVSQAIDDQWRKIRQPAIGYGDPDVEEEHKPRLRIGECFDHLLFFEFLVLDSSLIRA
jgi:hypothetical protein